MSCPAVNRSGKQAAGAAKLLAAVVGRVYYVQGGAAAWKVQCTLLQVVLHARYVAWSNGKRLPGQGTPCTLEDR